MFKFNNLSFDPILKNLLFHVEQSEVFGIVGPSGAGKTTLFRLLAGLTKPTGGSITWDGKPFIPHPSLIGFVFQQLHLLSSMTALENVAFPLKLHGLPLEWAAEALELVGMTAYANRPVARLSGGQRQKVAIARALAARPKALLFDEPTSALDPESVRQLISLLRKLNERGLTLLLITHEMDLVKALCHRAAVIDHGRIVEIGSVEQLLCAPKSPVTQQLLGLHDEGRGPLMRLVFHGEAAGQPLISQVVRAFPVDVNILSGSIDPVRDKMVGRLCVQITGKAEEVDRAIGFLESNGVRVVRFL